MQCYFITQAVDILDDTLYGRGLAYYGTEGTGTLSPRVSNSETMVASLDNLTPIFCVVVVALVVVGIIYSHIQKKKRREALVALAKQLGLRLNTGKDHRIASSYRFLDKLSQGSNRYAYNILSGEWQNRDVRAFDYHYATHSRDSKGKRRTNHHYLSFFILHLPRDFPELKISREGFLSKIAQAVGYDDIDFESHEFSRRFCVRCPDKKLAYDICNAQMIDYLLDNGDLNIEIEGSALALGFDHTLVVEAIEHNLGRILKIRSLIPGYLFG